MQKFESDYVALIATVIEGELRETRNGRTISIFGESLEFHLDDGFPILQGRQMFYTGVLGELAAMLRKPTCVADFERWGCNYWKNWADATGHLELDYGNAWFNWDGVDQVAELKRMLRDDPTNRRMLINSWRPDRLARLSLPCCHYSYQFYVEDGTYLNMIWTQRSADIMVGVPSDMIFAAAWLIAIAREFGLEPGRVKMDFGDVHIYEEHFGNASEYVKQAMFLTQYEEVQWTYTALPGADFCRFEPDDIVLHNYQHAPKLTFELK
jgi:thymidylate synthase